MYKGEWEKGLRITCRDGSAYTVGSSDYNRVFRWGEYLNENLRNKGLLGSELDVMEVHKYVDGEFVLEWDRYSESRDALKALNVLNDYIKEQEGK